MKRRTLILVLLIVACTVTAVGVVAVSASRTPKTRNDTTASVALPAPPYMVFRSLDRKDPKNYGRIAVVPLDDVAGPRTLGGLTCDRVDFQGRRGICLQLADSFPQRYRAELLGPDLKPTASISVPGVPSRARVSNDGRLGSVTTFVAGHSYASLGVFSTQARIFNMVTGTTIVKSLEKWPVTKDGKAVGAADRNFWGVTFAPDGDTFYATLATGGKTYLARGSIAKKSMTTIHENVECPSISPDGTRIAYKKRTGADGLWRLTVLDLATMSETPLAETQPIDDQVEWLDDETLIYGNGEAIWSVPADGGGKAERFLAGANSPSIVREKDVN